MTRSSDKSSLAFKIAIIGAGNVGATYAFTILLSGLVGEIVLIDINEARTDGEVMDLNHALPLTHPAKIWRGDYEDCSGADIVMIAAGTAQQSGESRLDLFRRNAEIFKNIVPRITQHNQEGIMLVATNPVDILSYVAWKESGFPASRVIGSGTVLDTARLRTVLGQRLGLDARNIHAYIIGEHGDSEVPVWSLANVFGIPIDNYCQLLGCMLNDETKKEISDEVRNAAYEIISKKGATYFAVAAGLMRISESILRNQNSILSVSNLIVNYYGIDDVYLSLPSVIGANGIRNILELPLVESEIQALKYSGKILKSILAELGYQ